MTERSATERTGVIRVVVAEDSPKEAACLEFLLSKNGYVVVIAQDGEEALLAVRAQPPDLVISGILMSKMDGYDLCRELKDDPATADVPVMLLTWLSDPADVLRGLAAGTDDFVLKPYDESVLLSRIEALLSPVQRALPADTREILVEFQGEDYAIDAHAQGRVDLLLTAYEETDGRHELLAEVARCIRKAMQPR